jgi:hypothetical protein
LVILPPDAIRLAYCYIDPGFSELTSMVAIFEIALKPGYGVLPRLAMDP